MTMNREKGRSFETTIYGAYHKMGQIEYLPVDPNGERITPQSAAAPPPGKTSAAACAL